MIIALTREVSPSFARCELTHLERVPIDAGRAAAEHREYERRLEALGCTVRRLPAEPELPDAVFVEDAAVVLDEVAVVARPGAASRRPETRTVAEALAAYRELRFIEEPGTLDGGDVLRCGRTLYVGRSSRTDPAGLERLRDLLAPFGYAVEGVEVRGCLHLKTAVTRVAEDAVLLNPRWVDPARFAGLRVVEVDPAEPAAANALWLEGGVIFPAAFERTRRRLEAAGARVEPVEVGEIAKAEGGVTCCSLIFTA